MIVQFSVFPLGSGTSIRRHVARALECVEKSGLPYRLTAMGTIVEGDWDRVARLLKEVHDTALGASDRVYMTVSMDSRSDKSVNIDDKVHAVEAAVGKRLG